jgi:hypothetical protein
MSAADIPYQLRPNKFIDRQMFVEMLSRLLIPCGTERYVYVSMGGRHLLDHHAIYNKLGIDALFSFDKEKNEVLRQKFNRPTGRMRCEVLDSGKLPARLDDIVGTFRGKENLVVWLDYTSSEWRSQFQEAVQTLLRLKHGDVFRITLHANPKTLEEHAKKRDTENQTRSPGARRAEQLRAEIAEFMPADIETIKDEEFPTVLVRCLELAVASAVEQRPGLRISPTLITTYRDGCRMVTAACAVSEKNQAPAFPDGRFSRWKYACKGWDDIQSIFSPTLSSKEQLRLDSRLHLSGKRMLKGLPFLPDEDEKSSLKAMQSYRQFHRYYPTFRHVED